MKGKMHPMLAEYTKHFPGYISAILEMYNGNSHIAIEAMNTLFNVVGSRRPGLKQGHSRHYGGGVGMAELKAAAEIGIALDIGPLEKILYVIVGEDRVLTAENAREILGRMAPCYNLPKRKEGYFT